MFQLKNHNIVQFNRNKSGFRQISTNSNKKVFLSKAFKRHPFFCLIFLISIITFFFTIARFTFENVPFKDIWNTTWEDICCAASKFFFASWSYDQWSKSIVGLVVLYFVLAMIYNNLVTRINIYYRLDLYKFTNSLVSIIIFLDLIINFAIGIFFMLPFLNHHWIAKFLAKCPIAISPFILVVELFIILLYFLITWAHTNKNLIHVKAKFLTKSFNEKKPILFQLLHIKARLLAKSFLDKKITVLKWLSDRKNDVIIFFSQLKGKGSKKWFLFFFNVDIYEENSFQNFFEFCTITTHITDFFVHNFSLWQITSFLFILMKIVFILLQIAYYTLAERKAMAATQRREGPSMVGFWGLLQPIADALKLLTKKLLLPTNSNKIIFLIAPILILILSLLGWSFIPFSLKNKLEPNLIYSEFNPHFQGLQQVFQKNILSLMDYPILCLFAISSLTVYGIITAGWSSNSKYAFLGSVRSSAQMISYEVSLGTSILPVLLLVGSLQLCEIVLRQEQTGLLAIPLFPCFITFFISMLAETNRTPFDLPEAEAELVAGYNVDYSSIAFALFFLSEYSNMTLMSVLISILFLGGWVFYFFNSIFSPQFILAIKSVFFCYIYILIRATAPRLKFPQLMNLAWKYLMPITLSYFAWETAILFTLTY